MQTPALMKVENTRPDHPAMMLGWLTGLADVFWTAAFLYFGRLLLSNSATI
jgi:hypothetical protein